MTDFVLYGPDGEKLEPMPDKATARVDWLDVAISWGGKIFLIAILCYVAYRGGYVRGRVYEQQKWQYDWQIPTPLDEEESTPVKRHFPPGGHRQVA